jgi:enoyl-CoA hydratase/carnithine racemase
MLEQPHMIDTSGSVLRVVRDGAVTILTLNRPEHLNSFDEALHQAFARFWIDLDYYDSVRAVVLTGAGRAFCAGGSIDDFDLFRTDLAARANAMRSARRLIDEMLNVRVPVVAALNGPAVGLGATLSSLCDVVFIADTAHLADPHVAVALVAGDGGAITWPHHTSLLKAKQYLLTGDRVSPDEAVALGLANFVAPAADVVTEAIAFAQRLAALPPQAVQDTKMLLNQHLRRSAVAALGYGLAAETHSHDTPEYAAVPERFRSRDRT